MNNEIINQVDENPKDGQPDVPVVEQQHEFTKGEFPELANLSEKEQKTSAAWKWAVSENQRLREYETAYISLKDKYADLDKTYSVLKSKLENSTILDIITSALMIIGPLALGFIPSISDGNMKTLVAIAGSLLLISAVGIKLYQIIKS